MKQIQMTPGRELDALIAEKVMGWVRGGKDDHTRPFHTKRTIIEEDGDRWVEHYLDWESKGPHDRISSPEGEIIYLCGCKDNPSTIPSYSTDIAAAWEVMEKLCQYMPKIRITENTGDFYYEAEIGHNNYGSSTENPAHALCLAALKAVGHAV